MGAKSWGDEDKQLFLTSDIMTFFWEHYADSSQRVSHRASPLLADDLSNLPPAVILTRNTTFWLMRVKPMQRP